MTERSAIDDFLHGQLACWNDSDKEGFFSHYRQIAPAGLDIEYVGLPRQDPWHILETMWTRQNARIRIDVAACIVNGNEAACHHRNLLRDGGGGIETMETYRFEAGRLWVRYFVGYP